MSTETTKAWGDKRRTDEKDLRRERAELQAAVDGAAQWGAAITARLERIRAIDRILAG
jgi:hypothetical protein